MMMRMEIAGPRFWRPTALLLTATLTVPMLLAGCGGGGGASSSPPPPPGFNAGNGGMAQRPMAQPQRQGMTSTQKKLVVLAGAAALYYLYKRHQRAQNEGPQGKYYMSESTHRVYYRDLKTGKFQWVSPPSQPIQVPADQAQAYSGYQGYNNNSGGQGFGGYGNGANNYPDAVPAQ